MRVKRSWRYCTIADVKWRFMVFEVDMMRYLLDFLPKHD